MKKSELFFIFALLPVDIIMILLAFVIAYWLRANQDVIYISPFGEYIRFIIFTLPAWILIFVLEGLYSSKNGRRRGADELAGIFMGVSSGIMLLVAWLFLAKTSFFSRLVIVYAWILAIVLVYLGRLLVRSIQKYLYRYGVGVHRVIFVGNNQITYNLVRTMQNNRGLGHKVIGLVNIDGVKKNTGSFLHVKSLGEFSDLAQIIKKHPTDEIILTELNISSKKISELIDFCEDRRLIFKQTPNLFEVKTQNTEIFAMSGIPILRYRQTPLEGWGKIIKRAMDILGSFILLVILSPVFLIIAIVIKLTSPGPVFFRQTRMREEGKTFTFLKFRSMYDGADKEHQKYIKKYGNMFKLKEDPRVTPFGRFLRKTSLDETPQFWNALIGEMSLVGPRPPMVEEVAFYNRIQKKRLAIKPGITGLWQVSGRSDVNFDDWVRLDLYYIENWSLWFDIKILFKTFLVIINKKGAY